MVYETYKIQEKQLKSNINNLERKIENIQNDITKLEKDIVSINKINVIVNKERKILETLLEDINEIKHTKKIIVFDDCRNVFLEKIQRQQDNKIQEILR